jgi:hypothetical protein
VRELYKPDLVNGHLNEAIFLDIREHRMKKNCKKNSNKNVKPNNFSMFFRFSMSNLKVKCNNISMLNGDQDLCLMRSVSLVD